MVVLPGHMHLDIKMDDLVSKPPFIKGSLLIGRVWLGATLLSPARMIRTHLRAQGMINKMRVLVLGFAIVTCAFVNNFIEMPEWCDFLVPDPVSGEISDLPVTSFADDVAKGKLLTQKEMQDTFLEGKLNKDMKNVFFSFSKNENKFRGTKKEKREKTKAKHLFEL